MSDREKIANPAEPPKQFQGSIRWLVAISAAYIVWLLWLLYVGWMHTVK